MGEVLKRKASWMQKDRLTDRCLEENDFETLLNEFESVTDLNMPHIVVNSNLAKKEINTLKEMKENGDALKVVFQPLVRSYETAHLQVVQDDLHPEHRRRALDMCESDFNTLFGGDGDPKDKSKRSLVYRAKKWKRAEEAIEEHDEL